MKSRYVASSILLTGLIGLASPAAMASDELAGLVIGAGAGAAIGHSINGHDGAVIGGILGAAIGASIADDDDRYWRGRPYGYVRYGYPRVYYSAPPPYWSGPRHGYPHWRYDRDGRWDRDHDGWRDRDRDGRHDGRDYDDDRRWGR